MVFQNSLNFSIDIFSWLLVFLLKWKYIEKIILLFEYSLFFVLLLISHNLYFLVFFLESVTVEYIKNSFYIWKHKIIKKAFIFNHTSSANQICTSMAILYIKLGLSICPLIQQYNPCITSTKLQ